MRTAREVASEFLIDSDGSPSLEIFDKFEDKLTVLILKDREEVKEECAKECDEEMRGMEILGAFYIGVKHCAKRIRALDLSGEKTQTNGGMR